MSVVHHRKRLADLDNLSIKAALDGMVEAAILADDSPIQIASITHFQVKTNKHEEEKTIVTITRVQ